MMAVVERNRTSNSGMVLVFLSVFATILVAERFWQLNYELSKISAQLQRSLERELELKDKLGNAVSVANKQKQQHDMPSKPCDAVIDKVAENLVFYNVEPSVGAELLENAGPEKIDNDTIITIGADEMKEGAPLLIGQLDMVEDGYLIGWACEKGNPINKQRVVLFIENTQIGEVLTDKPAPHSLVNRICTGASLDWAQYVVFNFKLPPLKDGLYKIRGFVYSADGQWRKELNSSPIKFVQAAEKPGIGDAIKRKDDIIRARNAQVASLYERLHTGGVWEFATKFARVENLNTTSPYKNDYLAFLGVNSAPTDIHHRQMLRETWFPTGSELKAWEEVKKVIPRFVIGKSDWLPQDTINSIKNEMEEYGDIITVDIRGFEDASKKTLAMIKTAVLNYKADFIFKVEKDVVLNVNALISYLTPLKRKGNLYIGCMKSGEIVQSGRKKWYEPEHWRFGDAVGRERVKMYHRHAHSQIFGISQLVALYLAQNSEVLHGYAHDDVTVGAWMLGLEVEYVEYANFCCQYSDCVGDSSEEVEKCISYYDAICPGVCSPDTQIKRFYNNCILKKTV